MTWAIIQALNRCYPRPLLHYPYVLVLGPKVNCPRLLRGDLVFCYLSCACEPCHGKGKRRGFQPGAVSAASCVLSGKSVPKGVFSIILRWIVERISGPWIQLGWIHDFLRTWYCLCCTDIGRRKGKVKRVKKGVGGWGMLACKELEAWD